MTQENQSNNFFELPFAIASQATAEVLRVFNITLNVGKTVVDEMIVPTAHQWVEQNTETVGRFVTPIAEHPLVKYATKVPGLSWFMAALGQVDIDKVEKNVTELRQQYPQETSEQLAHRVMVDTAWRAGKIGLLTNIIPPLALTLLAVDIAAINALQADMIYRIAAIYGFSLTEPTRRGEVLAIWGLSMGGSSVIKSGLSIVEILPGIGTVVGATSNATLLYSLGHVACRFYETKLQTNSAQTKN